MVLVHKCQVWLTNRNDHTEHRVLKLTEFFLKYLKVIDLETLLRQTDIMVLIYRGMSPYNYASTPETLAKL